MVTITYIKIPLLWETIQLIFHFWSVNVNVAEPRTFSTVSCKALPARMFLDVQFSIMAVSEHFGTDHLIKKRLKTIRNVRWLKMLKNVQRYNDTKSKDQLYLSFLNFEKDRKIIILPTEWLFALEGRTTKNRTIKTTMTKRRTKIMIMIMIE